MNENLYENTKIKMVPLYQYSKQWSPQVALCEIKERLDSICHGQAGAEVIQPMLETFEVSKCPKYATRSIRLVHAIRIKISCKMNLAGHPHIEYNLMLNVNTFAEKFN